MKVFLTVIAFTLFYLYMYMVLSYFAKYWGEMVRIESGKLRRYYAKRAL